jgi:site-specific recombinase XerD
MTRLHAVPAQPAPDRGDVPDDWPELRGDFRLALRSVNRSSRTIATYLGQCDAYAHWLAETTPGRLVAQSTRSDLRGYLVALKDRGLAPNSVSTAHRGLRALFKFAAADEIIATNPMRDIPAPQITEERVPPALSAEQLDAMVKACAPKSVFTGARDRALILLISSSGIRASECIGLTEADLHLDSEQPYVVVRAGKGDRYRESACSHEAALAVRAYLRARRKRPTAHRPELWLSRTGNALTTSGLLQIVRDVGKRVGLAVHTHSLRHTATHHMLARGMSDHDTAIQLGHKSLKMLGRYGRARATERSRAAFFRGGEQ